MKWDIEIAYVGIGDEITKERWEGYTIADTRTLVDTIFVERGETIVALHIRAQSLVEEPNAE